VCIALCTIVAHNIAQNRPDSFPPYPPDNHHCSDDVYLREGGDKILHCCDNLCITSAADKQPQQLLVTLQKITPQYIMHLNLKHRQHTGKWWKTCYSDNPLHKNCICWLLWNLDIGTSVIFDLLYIATTFANDHANCHIWNNNFYLHRNVYSVSED